MMGNIVWSGFVLCVSAWCCVIRAPLAASAQSMRVTVFRADVTPPIGHPINGGYNIPVKSIEDRIEAKGVVLQDGTDRYVLCAVDWCGLSNTAHAAFRDKIAAAAGTARGRVAVHCLHLHTAVLADGYAQEILQHVKTPIAVYQPKFLADVTDRVAAAVKASLAHLEPFDTIGYGQVKVDRVASSRRILVDGKLRSRMSSTQDAALRALPEGTIDPMLKTITLAQGKRPLVRLHFYATHPQSFYGDGRISSDVPGLARKQLEKEERVPQIYFTGCAGDVAMGKYNDGTRHARTELTSRLLAGMKGAIAATRWAPAKSLLWRTVPLSLPLRNDQQYNPAKARALVADPKAATARRIEAAEYLAFARRSDRPILCSALRIGPVDMVHLPAEAFVEYQLYAQRIVPERFVAVAAYGEYDPVYIPTEHAFAEGGYEPTEAMAAPRAEQPLKRAIRQLLGVSEYAAKVKTMLDTLIQHGRDYYGSRHSPLFAAILTTDTCQCPRNPPLDPIERVRLDPGRPIEFSLSMFRLTGDKRWLHLAEEVADDAIRVLWRGRLFVGHPGKKHYENLDQVGILLHGLLELDNTLSGNPVRIAPFF